MRVRLIVPSSNRIMKVGFFAGQTQCILGENLDCLLVNRNVYFPMKAEFSVCKIKVSFPMKAGLFVCQTECLLNYESWIICWSNRMFTFI
jgi:hypothetical protein